MIFNYIYSEMNLALLVACISNLFGSLSIFISLLFTASSNAVSPVNTLSKLVPQFVHGVGPYISTMPVFRDPN